MLLVICGCYGRSCGLDGRNVDVAGGWKTELWPSGGELLHECPESMSTYLPGCCGRDKTCTVAGQLKDTVHAFEVNS